MKSSDIFKMAFRNLLRRKSRTFLTVISVVIGVFAIIIMLSFSYAISINNQQFIENLGPLKIINVLSEDQKPIDKAKIRRIEHVKDVFYKKNISLNLKIRNQNDIDLYAECYILEDLTFRLLKPEDFTKGENINPSKNDEMIFGEDVKILKFPRGGGVGHELDEDYTLLKFVTEVGIDPSQDEIFQEEIKKIPLKLKGIFKKNDYLDKNAIYISEKTAQKIVNEDKKSKQPRFDYILNRNKKITYNSCSVVVDDINNIKEVTEELMKQGFQASSNMDIVDTFKKSQEKLTLILGAIGSVAFVVSAIGIMNTMLMSVYERHKEIGVMKVIGASVSDVRNLFIVEAGLIGFIGSVIGVILSLLTSFMINKYLASSMNMGGEGEFIISYIPFHVCLYAMVFSFVIGMLSGFLPAYRATKLKAIDMIREN